MTRGRGEDVQELKRRLSHPREMAQLLGIDKGAVRQRRDGIMVFCPFHNQRREPSCSIMRGRDGTLFYNCFSCQAKGDVMSLIAHVRGCHDFPSTVAEARQLAGMSSPENASSVGHRFHEAPLLTPDAFDEAARALLELSPLDDACRAYLAGRGILAEAELDGWGTLRWPEVQKLVERFGEERMRWLYREQKPGEPARPAFRDHVLLVPWRTKGGKVIDMQRRRLGEGDGPKYACIPGDVHQPHSRTPYGFDRVHLGAPIVLVEGAADTLALRAMRPQACVLGIYSASRWDDARSQVLLHRQGRDIIVAFDSDEAGEKCARNVTVDLLRCAVPAEQVRRVRPGAKDWGEVLKARLRRLRAGASSGATSRRSFCGGAERGIRRRWASSCCR